MDMTSILLHPVVLLIVLASSSVRASDSEPCPSGMYLQKRPLECVSCTICEVNNVMRIPCRADADTVCGPFVEFNFFSNERWSGRYGNDGTDTMDRSRDRMLDPQEGATVAFRPRTTPPDVANSNRDAVPTTEKWKELCFGLIGALAAVTSLALFYVFITHLRNRHGTCKNRSLDDAEAPVVYYHSQLLQHSPSPEPESEHPHLASQIQQNEDRRFLRRIFQPGSSLPHANEYVADIHGAKSSATPFLLHTIPETERENYPLARVHQNSRARPADHVAQNYADEAVTSPQVTEMLLNHHKCDSDSS